MSVANNHPDLAKFLPKWKRCRDVCAGQDAVHNGSESYLPRLHDQDDRDYAAMVMRTPFFNATWRTVDGLRGMIFRLDPRVDVPKKIEPYLDNVTLDGQTLSTFALEVVEECLKIGRLGLLVDYPKSNVTGMTMADAETLNLRPTLNMYPAETIINWQTKTIRNKTVLALVVLKEQYTYNEDEFTTKSEDRYRVLDLDTRADPPVYRVREFRIDKDGQDEQIGPDIYPVKQGKPLNEIPFYFLSSDNNSPDIDEPPLIDLVDMNLAHYRVTADYERACHFVGCPTPVISGYKKEEGQKLFIGSMSAWIFPHPEAKATFLEFHGQGLSELRNNLDEKKKEMAVLGARMLEEQKRGVETAEVAAIHRAGEQSMLASIAGSISDGLKAALQMFSDWGGGEGEVTFDLNRDFFPMHMDFNTLAALVSAWQNSAISKQTLFTNLQEGEIIPPDIDFETEEQRITDGLVNLVAKNAPPGGTVPTRGNPLDPTEPPARDNPGDPNARSAPNPKPARANPGARG